MPPSPNVFVGAIEGFGERKAPGQGWESPASQIRGGQPAAALGLGTG